jgi:hypothetical protein
LPIETVITPSCAAAELRRLGDLAQSPVAMAHHAGDEQ